MALADTTLLLDRKKRADRCAHALLKVIPLKPKLKELEEEEEERAEKIKTAKYIERSERLFFSVRSRPSEIADALAQRRRRRGGKAAASPTTTGRKCRPKASIYDITFKLFV